MRLRPTVMAVLCGACTGGPSSPVDAGRDGGDPQSAYTYSGCADAGQYGCPNELVFVCALRTIQRKYAACTTAADCKAVPLSNCVDALGGCPPAAVLATSEAAFRAEADEETRRYCTGATCFESGSCAYSFQEGRVACVDGGCVPLRDLDGG